MCHTSMEPNAAFQFLMLRQAFTINFNIHSIQIFME